VAGEADHYNLPNLLTDSSGMENKHVGNDDDGDDISFVQCASAKQLSPLEEVDKDETAHPIQLSQFFSAPRNKVCM